jgi:hypothetical protein
MFYNAHAFNQDIDSWDISSLTNAAVRVFVVPVKVFVSTVMATLECFPPRLGVTIMVY